MKKILRYLSVSSFFLLGCLSVWGATSLSPDSSGQEPGPASSSAPVRSSPDQVDYVQVIKSSETLQEVLDTFNKGREVLVPGLVAIKKVTDTGTQDSVRQRLKDFFEATINVCYELTGFVPYPEQQSHRIKKGYWEERKADFQSLKDLAMKVVLKIQLQGASLEEVTPHFALATYAAQRVHLLTVVKEIFENPDVFEKFSGWTGSLTGSYFVPKEGMILGCVLPEEKETAKNLLEALNDFYKANQKPPAPSAAAASSAVAASSSDSSSVKDKYTGLFQNKEYGAALEKCEGELPLSSLEKHMKTLQEILNPPAVPAGPPSK